MGLEAGKFFVSLGLTGAEKTLSGLEQVNDHFSGLKGMTTEAKLAILAALAGLEQMVSMSGRWGGELTKLSQFLNISMHDLQLWGNAAERYSKGGAQAFQGAIQNIQDAMNELWSGQGTRKFEPNLMSMMVAGGQKFSDAERKSQFQYWEKHPLEFFKHLVQLTHDKNTDKGQLGFMLNQANLAGAMDIAKMGAFNARDLALASQTTVSDATVSKLNQVNVEWNTFLLTTEKIIKLIAAELLPELKLMNKALNWGMGIPSQLMDVMGKTAASGGGIRTSITQTFNAVFNVTGDDAQNGKLKKKVKQWVHEAQTKTHTKTISKFPVTQGGI